MTEPIVSVGIMFQPSIRFHFSGDFKVNNQLFNGEYSASYESGKISFNGELYSELQFDPISSESSFLLYDVVIGIGFHWERFEDQRFHGSLKLIVEESKLTAINLISIEKYLKSVISSEMSATSSLELLKAHAVISRTWLLSQIEKRDRLVDQDIKWESDVRNESEWIKWWDREDHINFDVCADDHCQRYQGITRASQSLEMVEAAVDATRGELLMNGDAICDARFSKCCGGAVEEFQYCWEPEPHNYLVNLYDGDHSDMAELPDLRIEMEAEKWIRTSPVAYCNTNDQRVLSQVLNNYDQETADFYRWRVEYSKAEISELVNRRTGIDFGEIIDLKPIERGVSGRLTKLEIVGTNRSMIIGKELLIRRALSESHLYSSAFVVDKSEIGFVLIGAGWGHGVGLCQIGAAVMADKGFDYCSILNHYFKSTDLRCRY
ncbi:MAG: SpoIID/LytB domain-containing protein [Bacteroidales bacterium]